MEERAVLFIDGNNFYHGFTKSKDGLGYPASYYMDLDFTALARKLAIKRQVKEVRYYIGKVKQEGDLSLYTNQRKFLSALRRDGVTCRLGRVEKRRSPSKNTEPLEKWLAASPKGEFNLEPDLRRDLEYLCRNNVSRRLEAWLNDLSARDISLPHDVYKALQQFRPAGSGTVWMEKAVDVMIAVDMLSMAYQDDYDVAYLLSADGDYTPVVEAVRNMERKVFAASPLHGAALAGKADAFIPLNRDFFTGLWRETDTSRSSGAARKMRRRP